MDFARAALFAIAIVLLTAALVFFFGVFEMWPLVRTFAVSLSESIGSVSLFSGFFLGGSGLGLFSQVFGFVGSGVACVLLWFVTRRILS